MSGLWSYFGYEQAMDRKSEVLQAATIELHKENHELKLKLQDLTRAAEASSSGGAGAAGAAAQSEDSAELHRVIREKDQRIATLEAQLAAMQQKLEALLHPAAAGTPAPPP
eukprot:CAMPEP_0197863046 /NCGR_PEP_ID=MMETSP1438-20131217/40216_1 /TAXON_ID=1461541 /ORGANISM="Pterosperma sp., Strain CCMP1384" /LENGTH=110 /DNA_ID=CAMNT_0043480791 /DNA_START=54 /DNA_END=383 /DNA_ORIENTATION=-